MKLFIHIKLEKRAKKIHSKKCNTGQTIANSNMKQI